MITQTAILWRGLWPRSFIHFVVDVVLGRGVVYRGWGRRPHAEVSRMPMVNGTWQPEAFAWLGHPEENEIDTFCDFVDAEIDAIEFAKEVKV